MVEIVKFIYVRIIFFFLLLCVISIEGQIRHNWIKHCQMHTDCSHDMCKPRFKPYCIERMCRCRMFENSIRES